ncbi:MAG: hypothetical protein R3C14_39325 [Caldilineaceae bacterium]
MSELHFDPLFAPVDADLHLERIGGGNETEVYCTDDRRDVVKVKQNITPTLPATLAQAIALRNAARRFATVMSPRHAIRNDFVVTADRMGQPHLLVIQPYHGDAQPLSSLDYAQLSLRVRWQLASQLTRIIARSVAAYAKRGWMPDLYGRRSVSAAERAALNRWYRFPWRLWSFVVQRNLLRAHNLLLTAPPNRRIILVDYDPVTRGKLYQLIYYQVRLWLFWRDLALIALMFIAGWAP